MYFATRRDDGHRLQLITSPLQRTRIRRWSIAGILCSDDAPRFLVLAAFSRSAAAHVQEVRSAALLANASPKHRTWRTGVLKIRAWRLDCDAYLRSASRKDAAARTASTDAEGFDVEWRFFATIKKTQTGEHD
jgi:hypothetical protein